jgi:hypothetical protein
VFQTESHARFVKGTILDLLLASSWRVWHAPIFNCES